MDALFAIDWRQMFVPQIGLAEMFLRGTIVYLFLFFLLRLMRREAGSFSLADLLVIVIIADAAQNAMGADYHSITEGVVLVVSIVFWDFALDWLSFRFPRLRPYVRPPPLLLIKKGRLLRPNLRRELITEDELMGQLRQ